MTAVAVVFIVLGVFMLFVPMVYTVLNLTDKIGPNDSGHAFFLGFCLYLVFWFGAAGFLQEAVDLLSRGC